MIYISPVQEQTIGGAFTTQVNQWVASLIDNDPNQMRGGLAGDVNSVQRSWIPGKREVDGQWQDRQGGANLAAGFRVRQRMVIGHNANNQIAVYAKFTLHDAYVKLDYVASKPSLPQVECGNGVKPLRSMLAFLAMVGTGLQQAVKLEADGRDQARLVEIYTGSGWELTGENAGAGPEMILSLANLQRPLTTHKAQQRGTHWEFGGANTLLSYIQDGTQ